MPPKVSVCLITYNHEAYIKKCLDNILNQEVDFDFEVVIGEDKSTDNTLVILNEYQQKNPGLISIITSAANVGMVANWERTLKACKGQYIAIIEGDDYWTSPHKLQKQVNYLNLHADYSMCFHNVEVEYGAGIDPDNALLTGNEKDVFGIEDVILRNWFIPTCSIMLRQSNLPPFPVWAAGLKAIDLVVQLLVAMHGPIGYIKESLGVYRVHSNGISQVQWLGKANALQLTFIEIFEQFNKHTKGKYKQVIALRLQRHFNALMQQNDPKSYVYLKAMTDSFKLSPWKNKHMIKAWVIINFIPPGLYKIYRSVW